MTRARRLTVLYDAHCGVCREARTWLEGQPKFVPLEFVAAGSEEARRRFPGLNVADTLRRLTVVGDERAVYRGTRAWLLVLWALRDWRDRSLTFAWAPLRPFFGLGVWLISKLRVTTRCDGDSCGVPHADLAEAARDAGTRWDARARARAGPA